MPTRRLFPPIVAVPFAVAVAVGADGYDPSLLSRLGEAALRTAVAVADDGERVAASFLAGKEERESRVAVIGPEGDDPVDWVVDGGVAALRFGPDGSWLAAVVERLDRKGRRSASLVVFDLARPGRRPRVLTLPATARGLDVRREDGRIAVASEGEIRTFEAGSLRSGRVYALAGVNRSVAFVPGGTKILVGRTDGVWKIDLGARQDRDGMPVESRADTASPVVELAVAPSGDRGLARLEGDAVLDVRVDPLAVEPTGRTAAMVVWPGRGAPIPPPAAEVPPPRAEPPPPVPAPPPPAQAPTVPAETTAIRAEPPPPSPAPVVLPEGQVAGILTGVARSEVAAVRLLGPDNLLREASRVPMAPDGTWVAGGLPPGTYRVIAEGKSGAVLECAPPFRTVRIVDGGRVEVDPIEVRGAVR